MQIPILVDQLPNGRGFRARAGEPLAISAEAPDRSTAISEVVRKLDALVASGQLISVDIGSANPMARLIGTLDMNDPETQKWWRYVEEFRREMDQTQLAGEPAEDRE